MIGIKSIYPFFGGNKIRLADLPEKKQLDEQELEYFNTLGIDSVFDAREYSSYDLALAASKGLLNEQDISGNEIDMIIHIKSRLPEYLISSEATRLQKDLNASKATTLAICDLGCTDMSIALKLGFDFLKSNDEAEFVLISFGCKPYMPSRYRSPVTVLGDCGIAVLLSRTFENQIMGFEIASSGSYWDLFQLDYQNKEFVDYKERCTNVRRYGFELALESKDKFNELNTKVLSKNKLDISNVSSFILQNISLRSFNFYETAYGVEINRHCKLNLSSYGHLGPADIMLNYYSGWKNGDFKVGDKVLIMNNSPAAAWSSILVQS